MLISTSGIVIKNTRYGEDSVISKIFTRQFGMQTYIINSIHGAKSGIKASLIQPLTILDLVVYYHKLKEIQRIKEARCPFQLTSLHFEPLKSGICMFVSEVLFKVVKEEEANLTLYNFIEQFLISLDKEQQSLGNWPIYFLIQLSKILGFFPDNNFNDIDFQYFDLSEGMFSTTRANLELTIGAKESEYFSKLMAAGPEDFKSLKIPKTVRMELLHKLILYYKLHTTDFQGINSIEVLSAIS